MNEPCVQKVTQRNEYENQSKIDAKIDAEIDVEQVMKIDDNSIRKCYEIQSVNLYILIFFKIEFKLSEGVKCAKTIVLRG